jgi:putative flippase GtrA
MNHKDKQQDPNAISPLFGQFVRFAAVGATATCAHYALALLTSGWVGIYSANLLGYSVSVGISYFGHQRFSFQIAANDIYHRQQMPRFLVGSLTGLALSYLVLALARGLLGAPDWLALAAAVALVPIYTFVFNKLFVFRSR